MNIVESLSRDPKTIALHLFSRRFISKRVLQETNQLNEIDNDKATRLYSAVLGAVENDPHRFAEFLSLLAETSDGLHDQLAKDLRSALQQ